jgi:stress response protein YsnF
MKKHNFLKISLFGASVLLIAGCAADRGGTYGTYGGTYHSGYSASTVGAPGGMVTSDQAFNQQSFVGTDTEIGARQDASWANQGASEMLESSAAETGATARTSPQAGTAGESVVIPLYQEQLNVGKREVDAGTVTIRKHVETENVNQPIELRRETISIDRQQASGTEPQLGQTGQPAQAGFAATGQENMEPFQEQEITIQLKREEPVIEKRIVPAGQIVARTQVQTQTTNVQSQVRREEVAVDRDTEQLGEDFSAVGAAGDVGGQTFGTGSGPGQQMSQGQGQMITDLSTLRNATNPGELTGQQVRLNNVPVRVVVGPNLIGLGTGTDEQPIYVHLQQPIANLREGENINITGTINSPSQAPEGTVLTGESAHVLGAQDFFISARSAQKTNMRQ